MGNMNSSKHGTLEMNQYEQEWMRANYISLLIAFVVASIFWIYNVVMYIYPMNERSKLILMFYIITAFTLTCSVIYYLTRSMHPLLDPFIFDGHGFTFDDAMMTFASVFSLGLGWLICSTMYQLKTSIQVIYKLKTEEKANFQLKLMYGYSIIMAAGQLFLLLVFPFFFPVDLYENGSVRGWIVTDVFIISYFILLVSYCVVMCKLHLLLKNMRSLFEKEYWNIVLQFIFFAIGFLAKLAV